MNKHNIARIGDSVKDQTDMNGYNGINIRKDGIMGTSWRFFTKRNEHQDFFFSDEVLEGQPINATIDYIIYKLGEK